MGGSGLISFITKEINSKKLQSKFFCVKKYREKELIDKLAEKDSQGRSNHI